jgi:hypothetical protein
MASHTLMQRKTLSPENQAKIRCPVFPADVRISSCFELRDLVWRGEPPEVRRGCQAAMHADKCPINDIIKRMLREDCDPYHSSEPKVVPLDKKELDRIAPVLVLDGHMMQADVAPKERDLLLKANERAREGIKVSRRSAPRKQAEASESYKLPSDAFEKISAAEEVGKAAAAGDMTAAINAETQAQAQESAQ